MTLCECGCGRVVKKGNRFINGHNSRTEEFRKIMKKVHNIPEVIENHKQGAIKRFSKPGEREKQSKIRKKFYKNPKNREEHTKALNKPETKERCRQSAIKRFSKPGAREEWSKIQKKAQNTSEAKENHRQAQIKRYSKSGLREKFRKAMNTPESKENCSKGQIKFLNSCTPKEREKRLRNSFFKGNQKPNVSETKLIPMLEPFGFHYNGKGPVIINGKIPDFVHEEYLLLIEYDGIGGHDPLVTWVPDNKSQLDNQRDVIYRKAGYNVLRLYPEDLQKGKEFIQNKVKVWMVPILEKSVRSE